MSRVPPETHAAALMPTGIPKPPIFFEPSGRRWRRFLRVALGVGAVLGLALALALVSVAINPQLPTLGVPAVPHMQNSIGAHSSARSANGSLDAHAAPRQDFQASPLQPSANASSGPPLILGYYVNWDAASIVSLRLNVSALTHLVPEWFTLQNAQGDLQDTSDPAVIRLATAARLPILAMVTNFREVWRAEELHQLLNDPDARANLIDNIYSNLLEHGFAGVNIDFEGLAPRDRQQMVQFVRDLRVKLQPAGLLVTQNVPTQDDAYNLEQLAAVNDYLVLMAYDEHHESSGPGPVASGHWLRTHLEATRHLPRDKLIIGIGNYGYDWVAASPRGTTVTFADVMSTARATQSAIAWDDGSGNPVLRYQVGPERHEVWFLDAVTALNQTRLLAQAGVRGVGLWRLGAEDPGIWRVLRQEAWPPKEFETRPLLHLDAQKAVRFYGEGEILRVAEKLRDGRRRVWPTETGEFAERYERYPKHYVVESSGGSSGKTVALTFDDGPDPRYTPQILDILQRRGVPATFFVVGVNAEQSPALLKRIYDEGHEIGNHTYTHPDLGRTSLARLKLELNSTQRIIQHTVGVSTLLFRPPYAADSEPQTPQEIEAILRAQKLGYLTIGERIDPHDWEPGVTPDAIVAEVLAELQNGHIILLHDGGGDRSATVEALSQIIHELRGRGYRFVPVSELIGKTRGEVMPAHSSRELGFAAIAGNAFGLKGSLASLVTILFVGTIVLVLARAVVFGCLAVWQRRTAARRPFDPGFHPPVSVIIPARNEALVIIATVQSVLDNGYADFEVVVVDDGSTDATAELVQGTFALDPRVRLHRHDQAGKAAALNTAIGLARHDLVVAIDADTHLRPGTIATLARHFVDPPVGAVSGNVRVGNRRTWLTRFQSIEYICAFNLERRAFDLLNAITVVPGAVGAWRKRLIQAAGGFASDTVAEDTDVTLAIRRLGYRIRYDAAAIAFTEVPQTTTALAKQRFRWSFGTLQAAWKHRAVVFRPTYGTLGLVALPSIWLFQLVLPLMAPAAEIAALLALVSGNWAIVLVYGSALFAVELAAALLAYALERERPFELMLFFGQRLYYRLLLLYVAGTSVICAIKGAWVEWTKLERTERLRTLRPKPDLAA